MFATTKVHFLHSGKLPPSFLFRTLLIFLFVYVVVNVYLCGLRISKLHGNEFYHAAKENKSIVTNNGIIVFLCRYKNY